jgi:hypothetical protein
MGLFCVNFHVQTNDVDSLSAALDRRGVQRRRVLSAKNGWTSLYEEQASQQNDARIRDLASGLSRDLQVATIAFLVHDSDMACYWLYDDGKLLDEYNSCPDYFDTDGSDDESPPASGGRPDVFVRYCRPGVQEAGLTAILAEQTTFAEDTIGQLAEALGIDRDRALADYRDGAGGGPASTDGSDDDGDDDDNSGPIISRGPALASQLAKMLGGTTQATVADPKVAALVRAAADDDSATIERLLAESTPVDAEAPAPIAGGELPALKQFLPGGVPNLAMTGLLAAAVHKRRAAVKQLLQGGADPNRNHKILGTALHAATAGGEVEILQLLIDHGGDVNAGNAQSQTPLQVIGAARATRERLAQAQGLMKSMGMKIPGLASQLANITLPTQGWDACERLLKAHGAR